MSWKARRTHSPAALFPVRRRRTSVNAGSEFPVQRTEMSAGCKIRSFCILRPEGSPALWPEDVLPGHVVHCHRDAEHGCQGDEFRADVAVDGHAVVGAPVSHDGVYIAEGTLAGQARCKPGGGPGRIGPLVQHPVHFIGQQDGRPLRRIRRRGNTDNWPGTSRWRRGRRQCPAASYPRTASSGRRRLRCDQERLRRN